MKASFLSMKANRREEFPGTVSIEVTNHCNIGCPTCPQPLLSGERGYLDIDLFRNIVDECSRFYSCTSIVFTGFGEPLLHPELIQMSRYAKSKKIPIVRTYTNCILLNEHKADEILLKSGLDEITLSLNGPTPEIYGRIKGEHEFESVANNIEHFLARKEILRKKMPFVNLQLLKLRNVPLETERFIKRWSPLLGPGDCISFKDSHSFAGQVNNPEVTGILPPRRRFPCGQLWNYLFLSWNGDVSPCCADPSGKLTLGNAKDSSLRDLWHSSRMMEIRNLHLQAKYHSLPLCGQCEIWHYFL